MLADRDLIFVSLENWDTVWRRNQFVCTELARRHPDRRILFVGPVRDVSASLRRREMANLRGPATWRVPEHPNITVTRPIKPLPNSRAPARKINEALFRSHVRSHARRLGLRSPILWLNPHDAVHMTGRMGESAVIYDITDDWTHADQSDALRQRIIQQDEALCRRADAVIVCSQDLYNSKRPLTENLHLIPNGVDAAHYRPVLDDTGPLPPETTAWNKPVLGYTGTVHPDRLDVNLVEQVAKRMPDATIALIGPNHLKPADRARLQATGNVFTPGPMPYDRLPQIMRSFDVCIVPHRVSPFTESLNPIKLWEYLAAGKPIVSTPVAGFRDYPQHVRLASTAEEFVHAIQQALTEEPAQCRARRAEAELHSWASRVDMIENVMLDSTRDRPAPAGSSPASVC